MNNRNDKVIKNKMDTLTPLSCGIVYGKEEAWEKLQRRLEHKPAKKMMLWGWSVAACLLICLSVSVYLMRITNEPMVINPTNYKTSFSPKIVDSVSIAPTEQCYFFIPFCYQADTAIGVFPHLLASNPKTVTESSPTDSYLDSKAIPFKRQSAKPAIKNTSINASITSSKYAKNELIPKVSDVYPNGSLWDSNNEQVKQRPQPVGGIVLVDREQKILTTKKEPTPIAILKHYDRKNMKVVHLNDPDKDIRQPEAMGFVAQYKLPCIVGKLPVVHINDLYGKQYEPLQMYNDTKEHNSIVHLSINNPFVSYTAYDRHLSHNLFKLHLNSQN